MRRPRRDVLAVAAACAGLTLAAVGLPANAGPASPLIPSSTAAGGTPAFTSWLTTADQPTQEPTEEPTEEPTDGPSDEPADDPADDLDDQPTAPPTDNPPQDPFEGERQDPGEAYEAALRDAQTVAVAEAQRLLQSALTDIDEAAAGVEQARADAEAAREAEEAAQREAKVAAEVVERTQREIEAIQSNTTGAKAAVGTVIQEAYQNNGLSTVGVLLGADSPEELSDRYVGMQTLLRASDTALGRLAADEADLRNALSTLEGQRKEKEDLADEAAEKSTELEAAEAAAEEAQAAQEEKLEEYEHALALAEEAALEDYQLYMEQLDEATAVGEYLDSLTEEDFGPSQGTGSFVRPATGQVTSPYGQRLHPILGYVKVHTGIDFARGDGNIYAADSGTVVEAKFNRAYGYMVIVDHGVFDGQRLSTLYAHQTGLSVSAGQQVQQGQVIGKIGSTGYSTGPHLHFEVLLNGQHTDPGPWLAGASRP
ncbi:M23 family metallopeptidase [Phytoactinopolyspora mesophila]|uniref:Peptidoglycan DD-metalloendopeptidase family protein n=1 Tax=Phytoactinopolyspora mesophila TaxID=2650750 RepID=A0A7K3LY97_9ACTN|nr:M23 family metallopeptidase [Phytoactinopolyspora mesophila]NDL55986.1 peptidoglycan DD-metalloendopeptidase family protein [Phytoactinopolyspora mesophila]